MIHHFYLKMFIFHLSRKRQGKSTKSTGWYLPNDFLGAYEGLSGQDKTVIITQQK